MQRLEEAGVADKTCIVLTNDHYPYGLTEDEYNELAGQTLDTTFEKYRNSFICYVPGLSENIVVDEYCSTADILPTLLNLFGVDYDSRLLVGRDVFSDTEPLVLWPEYSWKTDKGTYEAESRTFTPAEGADVEDGYVERIKAIVSNKISYSREVQNMKYFQVLSDYLNGK